MRMRSELSKRVEGMMNDYKNRQSPTIKSMMTLIYKFGQEQREIGYHKGFYEGLQVKATKAPKGYIPKAEKWIN